MPKIIDIRISIYGIDKEFIRPEQFGFFNLRSVYKSLHFIKNYMSKAKI